MKKGKTYLSIETIEKRMGKEHADLVRRFRAWQEDANLMYTDVADGAGITVQTLSNYISGRRSTYSRTLIKYYLENEMSKFYAKNKTYTFNLNIYDENLAPSLLPIGRKAT